MNYQRLASLFSNIILKRFLIKIFTISIIDTYLFKYLFDSGQAL